MNSYFSPMLKIKSSGRSLAELLIAIGIGIIILLAITTLFFTNSQASRATDEKARLESEGRLALNLVAFHLRMAGYGQLVDADPSPDGPPRKTLFFDDTGGTVPAALFGCAGSFSDPVALTSACAGNTQPDAIAIRYYVDQFNSNSTTTTPTDCLGQVVTTAPTVVENRFFIRTNATTLKSELYCVGNGGSPTANLNAPQPIAENIIDMKIRYSLDASGGQSATTAPMDATAVVSSAVPDPWSHVVSVNVCLVAQSANDGVATSPQQYRDCAGQLITATDKRLYATFSSVITLRSRASGSI